METVALVVVKLSVHGCYALGAPVLLSWTPGSDVSYNTCFHPIAFCVITEQVSTLRLSILVRSAWAWINRLLSTLEVYDSMQSHKFSYNLGIIALTTGINCTRYRSCNYSQIALKFM